MSEYNLEAFKSDTLATQLLVGGMSFTLSSGNFSDTPAGMYSILVLEPKVASKREIIKCTVAGSTVTIVERGIDGTSEVQHEINASVIMAFTPTHYQAIKDGAAQSLIDGWQSAGTGHTYTSGSTITVPTGAQSKYSVGDKYWAKQSIPLTSYWPLISNVTDTKSGYNGTATDITYTSGGKFGNAATFNGTTSKIVISDTANLKPTGAFTVEMWFKTSSTSSNKCLFQSQSSNTAIAGFYAFIGTGNTILFTIGKNTGTTGSDYTTIVGTKTVTDGNIHHLILSYQNNQAKMFLDGKLEASGYMLVPVYAATNYVRIGCQNSTGTDNNFMNGQIGNLTFINGYAADITYAQARYALTSDPGTANITSNYYGYVTAVTDTLLTLTGGADYVLYNGAITSPYYSHSNAVGFPGEINLDAYRKLRMDGKTAIVTGWSYRVYEGASYTLGGSTDYGITFSSVPNLQVSNMGLSTSGGTTISSITTGSDCTFFIRHNSASQIADLRLVKGTSLTTSITNGYTYFFDFIATGSL